MSIYVADFETTVRDDFACVWLSALINVDNTDEVYYQTSIEEFYEKLYEINPDIVFLSISSSCQLTFIIVLFTDRFHISNSRE